ncbi:MAG: polyprenyl synthetase family protein [Alphaproteobacteria bacterium]|nr:polyprenyl synthetase family protein [Alphaproteobacteria bacterium]
MIPAVAGHLIKSGGKRLRPLLTLAAAGLYGYDGRDHVRLAAAVELIHGATLLHDDVVDESALRRGASTANVIWGNKESVLVGDFIFSRSFELMVATRNLTVLGILSRAAGVIAEGEVLQLGTQKNVATTFDMYLAVVEAKTAALFAAAAHVGAAIAGAPAAEVEALRRYGLNLGVAFQLIDDALDYSGVESSIGKTVGDDFREGKMTAPVVFALENADDEARTFWRRTIGGSDQQPEDLAEATRLVHSSGAIERTRREAERYAATALGALELAPAGPMRDALSELAKQSIERGH